MSIVFGIIVGVVIGRALWPAIAMFVRWGLAIGSLFLAYFVVIAIVPEMANLPAFLGTGVVWIVLFFFGGGAVFYVMGWKARVAATEQEGHERVSAQAAKDGKVSL